MLRKYNHFLNEEHYIVKMGELEPSNDIEKTIWNNRFNLKKNYDLFLSDIKAKKAKKSDNLKLFRVKRKNEGIFAENITRIIFRGENLNHFTKNHPYVDIAVMEPIEGITKKNELISVKSTLEYTNIGKILRDTKAIKFDSLLVYLIYAYNLYKNIRQPFSIHELQYGVKKWLEDKKLSQEQHRDIIYIILEHVLKYADNFSTQALKKFEDSLIFDIDKYLSDEMDIKDIKKFVQKEIKKLYYPVSLSIIFIGPNEKMKNVDNTKILNVYKTESIPLGEFFFKVMDKWLQREFFGSNAIKYLNFDDIVDVYKNKSGELFPTRIHIDFTDFEGKEKGNKRKRLYVATKIKDAYFDENEKEILDTIYKLVQDLEENPEKIDKVKNILD